MSKKQVDYTISDILRLRPSWFTSKQTNPDALNAALTQLHAILDHGFVEMMGLGFFDVFQTFDITTGDLNIGKLLFDYRSRLESERAEQQKYVFRPKPSPIADIPRATLLALTKVNTESMEHQQRHSLSEAADMDRMHANAIRDAEAYFRNAMEYSSQAERLRVAAEALREKIERLRGKRDFSVLQWLRQIPEQYTFLGVSGEEIVLFRNRRLIHTMSNAAGGVSMSLDMGYVTVFINPHNAAIRTNMTADYIDPKSGAQHPHLSGRSICWGNVQSRAYDAMKAGDWLTVLNLLEAVMTTYGGSPYREFAWYYRCRNDKRVPIRRNEEAIKPFMERIAAIVMRDCSASTLVTLRNEYVRIKGTEDGMPDADRTIKALFQKRYEPYEDELRDWIEDITEARLSALGEGTTNYWDIAITRDELLAKMKELGIRLPQLDMLKRAHIMLFGELVSTMYKSLLLAVYGDFEVGGYMYYVTVGDSTQPDVPYDYIGADWRLFKRSGIRPHFVRQTGAAGSYANINRATLEDYTRRLREREVYLAGKPKAQTETLSSLPETQSRSERFVEYITSNTDVLNRDLLQRAHDRLVPQAEEPWVPTFHREYLAEIAEPTPIVLAHPDVPYIPRPYIPSPDVPHVPTYRREYLATAFPLDYPPTADIPTRIMPDGTRQAIPREWITFDAPATPIAQAEETVTEVDEDDLEGVTTEYYGYSDGESYDEDEVDEEAAAAEETFEEHNNDD